MQGERFERDLAVHRARLMSETKYHSAAAASGTSSGAGGGGGGDSSGVYRRDQPVRKRWACPDCGKTFANSSNCTKHVKVVHMKEKQHRCSSCGRQFSQKTDVQRHFRRVHRQAMMSINMLCSPDDESRKDSRKDSGGEGGASSKAKTTSNTSPNSSQSDGINTRIVLL
ncbi:hypothetical protein NDN08_004897 [Rhodosorus marinus]|uniref:C2H2-type domain-containing protein n=1 Tax=Rhodosorus marinus TaxID=101924 RepID=A0AAV8UEZ4_9RHOD|nr:hypothetical protein NDN08_004897 [Rhodosorus marinus]